MAYLGSGQGGSSALTTSSTRNPRLDKLKTQPRKPGEAGFFFYDAHFKNDAVKVLPGEFFVHDEDVLIMTTLGSCIAACLWDREKRVGGMNHFLLPDGQGGESGRYGFYAMELLIGELVKRGATAFVLDYLRTERITVVSKDVLDTCARKVCFLPASGKAMVKRLAATSSEALVAQERAAAKTPPAATTSAGSVDLF
jgi:chemotaxis protein CheD